MKRILIFLVLQFFLGIFSGAVWMAAIREAVRGQWIKLSIVTIALLAMLFYLELIESYETNPHLDSDLD